MHTMVYLTRSLLFPSCLVYVFNFFLSLLKW